MSEQEIVIHADERLSARLRTDADDILAGPLDAEHYQAIANRLKDAALVVELVEIWRSARVAASIMDSPEYVNATAALLSFKSVS